MARDTRITTIFTKQPAPGLVKTRLAAQLGPRRAADLALAMLDDTVAKCVAHESFETVLCITPAAALSWFRERYPGVARIVPQIGQDLGERLARRFEDEFELGSRTLVALGSDAPHVPVECTREAHERLEHGADVVLGLDDGGGYHLIGLRRPVPDLFRAVPMSTADMGERTALLARSLGLCVEFVAPSFDIDEPDDLELLQTFLACGVELRGRIPRTAEALRALHET